MGKKYLQDYIERGKIKKWKSGDNILIDAQTGIGKSHFFLHRLPIYFSSILILSNRTLLKSSNEKVASKEIKCMNYQALENIPSEKMNKILEQFEVIIFDECHYFFKDSEFNKNTDIVLDYALAESSQIKIFASATPEPLKYCGIKFNYEYYIPRKYKYINKIIFFSELSDIMDDLLQTKDKSFIVANNSLDAYNMQRSYPSKVSFLCSKQNFLHSQVDKGLEKTLIEKNKFPKHILVATTVLDSGFSLIDTRIKNVVITLADKISIIQGLGRKRIQGTEKITLYLQIPTNNVINKILHKKIETSRFSAVCYNKFIREYYEEIKDKGFIGYWLKIFDIKSYKVVMPKTINLQNFLLAHTDQIVKKEEIYKQFSKIFTLSDKNTRPVTYNRILKNLPLPYEIISDVIYDSSSNKTIRVWKVISTDLTDD